MAKRTKQDNSGLGAFLLVALGVWLIWQLIRFWYVTIPVLVIIGVIAYIRRGLQAEQERVEKLSLDQSRTINQWRHSSVRATRDDRELTNQILDDAFTNEALTFDEYLESTQLVVQSKCRNDLWQIIKHLPDSRISNQ